MLVSRKQFSKLLLTKSLKREQITNIFPFSSKCCPNETNFASNLYKFDARPYAPDRRPLNEVPRPLDYDRRPLKEIPRPFDFDRHPSNEIPRPLDYPAGYDQQPPTAYGYPHHGLYDDAFNRRNYPDSMRGGYPATRPENRFAYGGRFPPRRPTGDDFYNRNVPWAQYPNRRIDHDIGNET